MRTNGSTTSRIRLTAVCCFTAALLPLALCACGLSRPAGVARQGFGNSVFAATASSASVVTDKDLATVERPTLYEALARVRPEFLRPRNSTPLEPSGSLAAAYIDGVLIGDVNVLRDVTTTRVREVRYLSRQHAEIWFGRQHRGGAIVITTR